MSYKCPVKIRTNDFNFITCSCYYSDWKNIKETEDESWKFDEIEKGKKSFRKLYYAKKVIVHCCYSCFEKAIMMNPFIINDDNAKAGFCIIKKFLNAFDSCKEICNTCIYFFVNEFKDEFNFVWFLFRWKRFVLYF